MHLDTVICYMLQDFNSIIYDFITKVKMNLYLKISIFFKSSLSLQTQHCHRIFQIFHTVEKVKFLLVLPCSQTVRIEHGHFLIPLSIIYLQFQAFWVAFDISVLFHVSYV